jgi:hypothetical protein
MARTPTPTRRLWAQSSSCPRRSAPAEAMRIFFKEWQMAARELQKKQCDAICQIRGWEGGLSVRREKAATDEAIKQVERCISADAERRKRDNEASIKLACEFEQKERSFHRGTLEDRFKMLERNNAELQSALDSALRRIDALERAKNDKQSETDKEKEKRRKTESDASLALAIRLDEELNS